MFRFFEEKGYEADIPGLRKEYPGLMGLGEWIETKSAYRN